MDKGALVLASPEIRFHIDSETHDPIEVSDKTYLFWGFSFNLIVIFIGNSVIES